MTRDERRCALYRHFDDQDVLLYVGISVTPVDRTNAHAQNSEWAAYADRAEAQWFSDRFAAGKAEREAIRTEVPIFNRSGAVGNVDQRIEMYLCARQAQAAENTLFTYRYCVNRMLERLPAELREVAFRAALHDFHCAGEPVDQTLPAQAVRHLGDMVDTIVSDRDHLTAIVERVLALLPADTQAHYRDQVTADYEQIDGPGASISPETYAAEIAGYFIADCVNRKAPV